MARPLFQDKELQYAYHSIHDFFDFFDLSNALLNTEMMLKAAISENVWKKSSPARLLILNEKLDELCAAAFIIQTSYETREEAILKESTEPDVNTQQNYVGRFTSCTPWNSFPRSLTAKQYNNPYRAIKKFTAYMPEKEWNKTLKDLTEYALGNNSINELYMPYSLLTLRLRLLQLIEACHLINVRTSSKKIEPLPKQKKKKNNTTLKK